MTAHTALLGGEGRGGEEAKQIEEHFPEASA